MDRRIGDGQRGMGGGKQAKLDLSLLWGTEETDLVQNSKEKYVTLRNRTQDSVSSRVEIGKQYVFYSTARN